MGKLVGNRLAAVGAAVAVAAGIVLTVPSATVSAASESQFVSSWTGTGGGQWVPSPGSANGHGPSDDNCIAASSQPGGAEAFFTFPAFGIPAGDTIDGVEVTVDYVTAGAQTIQLTDGGSQTGSSRPLPVNDAVGGCSITSDVTLGGPADLWGGSFTPADFNSGDIGVYLVQDVITLSSGDPGSIPIDIDSVKLTVYHSGANAAPTADAGGPYTVAEGGSVTLDGSGSSDPDTDPLTYSWDLDDDGTFGNATGVSPSFSAAGRDGPDTQTIALIVNDGTVDSAADTATVTIENVAPTIDTIVASSTSIAETQSVVVSGTFSDPGTGETYSGSAVWSDGASTPVTIGAGTFSTMRTFPDDDPNTGTPSDDFTVDVTVDDGDGGDDTATSPTITVNNLAPGADAGPDQVIEWVDGQLVDLDASASADPSPNDTLSFAWTFVSTPAGSSVAFDDPTSATPSFLPDELGTYEAEVTVTDDDTGADTDTVVIVVEDTTAPDVTAALVPITLGDDDDDDGDEGLYRVEFSCTDACDQDPKVRARLNGIKVQDGQVVSLEFDDDREVEFDDGILEIEAPKFKLKVRCKDDAGNVGKTKVVLHPPPDDDDDDDDDDDGGDDDDD